MLTSPYTLSSMRGNGVAVAGFTLSICAWALIWLFPFAFLCWVLGAVFSSIGERRAVRHCLPLLRLARTGIAFSILPVMIFTGIVLYGNLT